jgi:RNA polymerase sigma-54 factor
VISLNFAQQASIIQQQKFTQHQIQSLHILTLDNVELNEFLQIEYSENPLMEYSAAKQSPVNWNSSAASRDDSDYPEIAAKDPDTLLNFFLEQLNPRLFSKPEWNTFKLLILLLDENGFFPYTSEDLYHMFQISPAVSSKCLEILRALQPQGVFQPNIESYLLFQLKQKNIADPNLFELIEHHLEHAASNKFRCIADDLHISLPEVRNLIRQLKELSPRPLSGGYLDNAAYITPDILAVYENGQWDIFLNDQWIGNYSLNDYYIKMMHQSSDPQLKSYFHQKYERANFIIQRIEQRRTTILSICQAIFRRQENYFLYGSSLVPMTLSDIASDLGFAVSTISRGIKNKYLQYPHGTVLLKDLFTSGIPSSKDTDVSCAKVIETMKKIIASENKKKPYSDNKLAALLNEKGIKISRRTVAKYRMNAGIPSTLERKNDR